MKIIVVILMIISSFVLGAFVMSNSLLHRAKIGDEIMVDDDQFIICEIVGER